MAHAYTVTCPNPRCRRKLGPFTIQRHGVIRCAHCGAPFRI
jgi:DNA-directed RNA polymerase subunit RPC12/RpoP